MGEGRTTNLMAIISHDSGLKGKKEKRLRAICLQKPVRPGKPAGSASPRVRLFAASETQSKM